MSANIHFAGRPAPIGTPSPAISGSSAIATSARRPSITILTPLLNSATYLPSMLQSVLTQSGALDLQWIVIDGGSQDQTVSLLKSIRDPRVQWISEPDSGQAAAINKGMALARGDIIAWLNGDDLYCPNALAAVADAFMQNPKAQWLIGRCNIIDESGKDFRRHIVQYKNRLLRHFSTKSLLRMNMISQPAVFWRREFGQSVGPLDESLIYTMDYDLWLRMARKCPPLIVDRQLASFRVHTNSKSRGGRREQFYEGYRVACRYQTGRLSRLVHRLNVEKICWGYSAFRLIGR